MPDYTIEELQKMLDDKYEEEFISGSILTEEEELTATIESAGDFNQYILRDSSNYNKVVYSYIQSETVGKRMTTWCKYKTHGTTYLKSSVSSSVSTNLNEIFSQTGLIIED